MTKQQKTVHIKPGLDTEIPDIDVYSGDRFINIIYGNRLAKQELTIYYALCVS